MQTTIEADGDHYILTKSTESSDYANSVNHASASKIKIRSNIDGATVTIGEEDGTGTDTNLEYSDGDITTAGEGIFEHGVGEALMATVSGLGANPLVINHRAV